MEDYHRLQDHSAVLKDQLAEARTELAAMQMERVSLGTPKQEPVEESRWAKAAATYAEAAAFPVKGYGPPYAGCDESTTQRRRWLGRLTVAQVRTAITRLPSKTLEELVDDWWDPPGGPQMKIVALLELQKRGLRR